MIMKICFEGGENAVICVVHVIGITADEIILCLYIYNFLVLFAKRFSDIEGPKLHCCNKVFTYLRTLW